MNDTTFGTQTSVYFRKIFRIAIREKAWKYLIFAAIISSIVALITGPDMFKNFEERRKKKSLEKNKKIQNDGVKKSKKRKIDKEEMIKRLYKKEIEKLKEKNEKEDKLKK